MTAPIEDELAKLQALSWRGIEVPAESVVTSFSQGLVKHGKPDQDGVRIESTGRNEKDIVCRIPFLNAGVSLGPGYNGGEKLFPTTYARFWTACEDRSTGTLVHPTRGTLQAKIATFRETIAAGSRDGVWIDVTWNDTLTDTDAQLTSDSPVATMTSAASDLDDALPPLENAFTGVAASMKNMRKSGATFSDLVRSVQTTSSTATLVSSQYAQSIPRILHQLQQLRSAFDATSSATVAPARSALERLVGSLRQTSSSLNVRRLVFLSTPTVGYQTLGAVSKWLRTIPGDLIALNPSLAASPVVQPDTVVRYYGAAA